MAISSACITCGALIPYGTSRCPAHTAKNSSNWSKHQRANPAQAAYYHSGAWRERRARQLAENPNCGVCGQPARHVDHVIPIAEAGRLDGPLQSLCVAHHRAKTQAESKVGNKRAAARRRQTTNVLPLRRKK